MSGWKRVTKKEIIQISWKCKIRLLVEQPTWRWSVHFYLASTFYIKDLCFYILTLFLKIFFLPVFVQLHELCSASVRPCSWFYQIWDGLKYQNNLFQYRYPSKKVFSNFLKDFFVFPEEICLYRPADLACYLLDFSSNIVLKISHIVINWWRFLSTLTYL